MQKKVKIIIPGVILIVIIFSIFLLNSKNNAVHKETNQNTVSTKVKKEADKKSTLNTTTVDKQSEASKTSETTNDEENNDVKSQNISDFKEIAKKEGFYISIDNKLELANDKNLSDIETKIPNPVIYQTEKDGEKITVVTNSEQ